MVVEHVFITTMDAADALAASSELLARYRFTSQRTGGFALSTDEATTAEFERKRRRRMFRLSNGLLDLAQRVRVDFDRGRVTVVAALDNLNANLRPGSRGFFNRRGRRVAELQTDWLMSIARALDARLEAGQSADVAERQMTLADDAARAYLRRQARNVLIVFGVIALAIAALITAAVMADHR